MFLIKDEKLFKYIVLLFSLIFVSLAYSEEPEKFPCMNWTLNSTIQWGLCKAHAELNTSGVDFAKEQAKDYAQAAALDLLASYLGLPGGIETLFGAAKPTELQIALDKILAAIQISETRILDEIDSVFEGRDAANLESLKSKVKSYFVDGFDTRYQSHNRVFLNNLWEQAVDLRELYTTHFDRISTFDQFQSYQAYIAIVSLELMLRAEKSYMEQFEINNLTNYNSILRDHYKNELLGVFSYVDSFDWKGGVDELFTEIKIEDDYCISASYYCVRIYTYRYQDEFFRIKMFLDLLAPSGNLTTTVENGDLSLIGVETGAVYNVEIPDGEYSAKEVFGIIASEFHPITIRKRHVEAILRTALNDGYQPTVDILDSWWALMSDDLRPENFADKLLASDSFDFAIHDPGEVYFINSYIGGPWKKTKGSNLKCNLITGDNRRGAIISGGSNNQVIKYTSNYASGIWRTLKDPGINVEYLAGENKYGAIIAGGLNHRTVKYMNSYAANSWKTLANTPFEIMGLTGNNRKGPIVYNGRSVAYMSSYSANRWYVINDAPFEISGIAGENEKGAIIHNGAGNKIAYITSYKSGVWKNLKPPVANGDIVDVTGNNGSGIIVSYANGDIYYITSYSALNWKKIYHSDYPVFKSIAGENHYGVIGCGA